MSQNGVGNTSLAAESVTVCVSDRVTVSVEVTVNVTYLTKGSRNPAHGGVRVEKIGIEVAPVGSSMTLGGITLVLISPSPSFGTEVVVDRETWTVVGIELAVLDVVELFEGRVVWVDKMVGIVVEDSASILVSTEFSLPPSALGGETFSSRESCLRFRCWLAVAVAKQQSTILATSRIPDIASKLATDGLSKSGLRDGFFPYLSFFWLLLLLLL